MALVFVYGSMLEPIVRNKVLGRIVDTEEAVLRGYQKVCGGDILTIVSHPDRDVKGIVFDASSEDMEKMDEWEGCPEYQRMELEVEVGGTPRKAVTYATPEPPRYHEAVGDDVIASIPLKEIIRTVEAMVRKPLRSFLHFRSARGEG
ncbi:MAG: gamma-glutamylcyclotransferase [Candidatus Methanomethylophilaceae archaeon]|nr:gamma-glutamylcyclotransferase [Candidatus Methanomethylophilaceae archaeon]